MTVIQERPKEALVIKAEKNRDWREESRKRRRKNLLPPEVQAQQNGKSHGAQAPQVDRDEVSKTSGLRFVKQDADGDTAMAGQQPQDTTTQPPAPPKTAEEEALASLLGNSEKKSTLTIPALETDLSNDYEPGSNSRLEYQNENDRFKADLLSRPDVATLDDYAAVPVEDFGAAMLRGMGWKEGGKVGKQRAGATNSVVKEKPRVVERRPALLGIGAKEVPGGVGEEFGAWGKVAKGKRKTDLLYNPVVMKNSVTGELLSEEELKAKVVEQSEKDKKKGEDDWRERRDRNLKADADRKGERRDRDRLMLEDGRSDESNGSKERKRRHRSRSKERRRRDQSREYGESRHSLSRRHSRSRERSHKHDSSRREKSRSAERRHRRS